MLISGNGSLVHENALKNYEKIIFYGASTRNKKVIDQLGIQERVCYLIDSDKRKQGTIVDGYKVCSPDVIEQEKNILILSVLVSYAQDVVDNVKKYGDHECVFYLAGKSELERISVENRKIVETAVKVVYIHIFPEEKFLIPFYSMLEDHFNMEDHLFILDYNGDVEKYGVLDFAFEKNKEYHNILIMKDFKQLGDLVGDAINCNYVFAAQAMECIVERARKVILHSMFLSQYALQWIQSMIKKTYGNKIEWMCWGGDSYFNTDDNIVTEILQKIRKGYVIEAEVPRISKCYRMKMELTNCPPYSYILPKNKENKKDKGQTGTVHIMLGHSAAEYGNHEYGLAILQKYCSQDMKIYCPLSYGSETYRDKVIKKGLELFGDKFVPILDFMELEKYYAFLESMDIIVLPMTRGAAGTTLGYVNSFGKKIYMNQEMVGKYADFHIRAENIELIEKQDWKQFVENTNIGMTQELNEELVLQWKNIFAG